MNLRFYFIYLPYEATPYISDFIHLLACRKFYFSVVGQKDFKNPYVLVQNYTINDYHASCQNWDVYVSEHGALYVANNSGLLEFDGNTWHLYQTDDQESLFQIGMRNDTFSVGENGQMAFGVITRK